MTFIPGSPSPFDTVTGEYTDEITNTYNPPADAEFTATKTWEGGPNLNKIAVTLNLYRKSDTMTDRELVTGVTPHITGEAPTYTYKWENLVSRDSNGNLYTFTVEEPGVDTDGYMTTLDGSKYKVSYDEQLKDVTNTYQIPKDKDVTATKEWIDGPNSRPNIWFKLQRRIPGGVWEDVPGATLGTYAEIKKVPAAPAELSVTWEDQDRTNFNGIPWQYTVLEGTLEGDVFTEGAPANYELSGQDTLDLTNTYVIPKDTVVAKKQWVNGPAQKPTVWFKLQRALPGGQPADIPADEAGGTILKLPHGTLSVQWADVEQTDIDGKPYTFSIVEGVRDAENKFVEGLPDSYEYTATAMEGSLGVVNTYTSPIASKTTKKIWAGNGPTPYPEIWLRLERTTSPTVPFEAVPNAAPTKASAPAEGSTESEPITWDNIALKDDNGAPYYFRVMEGTMEGNTFNQGTPANYVSDSGPIDLGQGLNVTNTWQTFDLSVEVIWDGAPAEAYGLPAKTVKLSLYRWHEGESKPEKPLGSVTLDGSDVDIPAFDGRVISNGWKVKVAALPKIDPINGEPYVYWVEQSDYPAIYTATVSVQNDKDWVFTNTFDKTTVEVFKKYEQTTERPPVTIVLFQNGVRFHSFELDGIPDGLPGSGEPYEKQAGLLIWPNLPTRTMSGAEAVYTITEELPAHYPYQRIITGDAVDGFLITNTYNEGRFTAIKRWNIGQAPLPREVTFKLWRWVAGSNHHYEEQMAEEYDGVMDGTVDATPGAHGMEKKPWEYTWLNLPLNGNHDNDPKQPVYYTYFVKEEPLGSDYTVDTVSSSSAIIKNIALKTQFTAQKVWFGEPKPTVYLQLVRTYGTESVPVGDPVELDGVVDDVEAGQSGELTAWHYTWTDLPRFVGDDSAMPYTYTAREVDSAGKDFIPTGYVRHGNDSDRIVNIQLLDVSATKIWVGGDAQRVNGIGPETYLTLYRRDIFQEEGEADVVPDADLGGQSVTKPVSLSGVNNNPEKVTVVWEDMPWGTDDGMQYIYSVVETDSAGNPKTAWQDADDPQLYIYNTTYDETDPLKVTDTYKSPTREVVANKFWYGVAEGDTLPAFWLRLLRGFGIDDQTLLSTEEAEVKAIPSTTFAVGHSNHVSWINMPKFDFQGREYIYTTREYRAADATEPGAPLGFANNQAGLDQHNVKQVNIKVSKLWKQLPVNASHPKVILQLKRAEVGSTEPASVVDTYTVEAGTEVSTQHTFTNLPTHGMNEAEEMVAYIYTVDETSLPSGYVKEVSGDIEHGFTITNTYDGLTNNEAPDNPVKEDPVTIHIMKFWHDEDGHVITDNSKLPVSLVIKLTGTDDSEHSHTLVPDAEGAWKHTYTDLYKYDSQGEEITYALTENVPPGYGQVGEVEGDLTAGFTLTNAYASGSTSVQVMMAWEDGDNQDGVRPESVTIKLLADGVDAEKTLILSQANDWTDTFDGLDDYRAGKKIIYSIEKVIIGQGYTTTISGDAETGFVVTSSRTPETVEVKGDTIWKDNNDQGSKRPESITIHVLKNGKEFVSKVVTAGDDWAWSFTGLPKYENGKLITYTIKQNAIPAYKTTITTAVLGVFVINNTYEQNDRVPLTGEYSRVHNGVYLLLLSLGFVLLAARRKAKEFHE